LLLGQVVTLTHYPFVTHAADDLHKPIAIPAQSATILAATLLATHHEWLTCFHAVIF
jgi:hypothetical protein